MFAINNGVRSSNLYLKIKQQHDNNVTTTIASTNDMNKLEVVGFYWKSKRTDHMRFFASCSYRNGVTILDTKQRLQGHRRLAPKNIIET